MYGLEDLTAYLRIVCKKFAEFKQTHESQQDHGTNLTLGKVVYDSEEDCNDLAEYLESLDAIHHTAADDIVLDALESPDEA
jgi:hypothetical protein